MSKRSFLSAEDIATIGQCLNAAVNGPFFPDWEFATLMGASRNEMRILSKLWPDQQNIIDYRVTNALNNLCGYPHDSMAEWHDYIDATPQSVRTLLSTLIDRQRR